MRKTLMLLMAIPLWMVAAPEAQSPSKRNSSATITGAFADSCRDFIAHSSKDISYIELHYVAGAVVRDESINSHDHAIDGGASEEIEFAAVKSGTTIEEFGCVPTNRAPTALLEIQTPPVDYRPTLDTCYGFWAGGLACEWSTPRTAWTNNTLVPNTGGSDSGLFHWVCGDPLPCPPNSFSVVTFRGIFSSDPDGDLTSWTLDFGDGTSASGDWNTALPAEIAHDYSNSCGLAVCVVTLTVTDYAGQSHSDVIRMGFIDLTQD